MDAVKGSYQPLHLQTQPSPQDPHRPIASALIPTLTVNPQKLPLNLLYAKQNPNGPSLLCRAPIQKDPRIPSQRETLEPILVGGLLVLNVTVPPLGIAADAALAGACGLGDPYANPEEKEYVEAAYQATLKRQEKLASTANRPPSWVGQNIDNAYCIVGMPAPARDAQTYAKFLTNKEVWTVCSGHERGQPSNVYGKCQELALVSLDGSLKRYLTSAEMRILPPFFTINNVDPIACNQ